MKKSNNNNKKKINTRKTRNKIADIITENQPLKFRQTNNFKEEKPNDEVEDDSEWEDGSIEKFNYCVNVNDNVNGVTVEFDALPPQESPSKKKRVKRASAEDKEVAELVHKVHLLCLLARGRFIDAACDDPLIQAALLSLLPPRLLEISEATKLSVNTLTSLVSWFHRHFHVKSANSAEKPFNAALARALEIQGGSPEEVAALSVALFRALNLTTRFVSVLDVASLKPEIDADKALPIDRNKRKNVFSSSTLMVNKIKDEGTSEFPVPNGKISQETSDQSTSETQNIPVEENRHKRKGDLEFELQLQMAVAATSVKTIERKPLEPASCSSTSLPLNSSSLFKKLKRIVEESPSCSNVISTAIGSKKVGAPLYWAEVFCSGENMTGKWVHIDAINSIIDGELKVETLAAACKKSLRYVVAFAGHGAKDVTRRYCAKWYQISPKRADSGWWDTVLSPLKELESRATSGVFSEKSQETCSSSSSVYNRSAFEDMELATRALTEPLPTNQQAYRSHPLYAIEKWLSKYQILHPKGPIPCFCSGHAVYPRTCVQTLHTKERWLREGLQVRVNELPSKVVKSSNKKSKGRVVEVENTSEGVSEPDVDISLFGKWQTEPLVLPHAVDGRVPKNERGQVDVWSEKCLPPGTIHLRLPRLVPVVKRLGIDFAPAMVGFEFRSGRSVPVYEGLVVCSEFREAILETYREEEQRREEEENKRDEREALSRWYQLLSSMVTRQRLNEKYLNNTESETVSDDIKVKNKSSSKDAPIVNQDKTLPVQEKTVGSSVRIDTEIHEHEHVFLTDDESFDDDDDSVSRAKKCRCGLSIQVEEM